MIEKKANFKESLERRDRDRKISEEGRKEGREEEETDRSLKMLKSCSQRKTYWVGQKVVGLNIGKCTHLHL